ncbi:pentatricopeptide repeat-containing family protein [Striga asiatica]|uniref:Pentatricopeptide repeat-containing family protein n=1 Tax=Striga asiatica TaxID=4170 RepID=A0A5A7R2U7_STRAF|nr:pentatricopeptide repeat-containing family protein [Striga asiatica]
MQQCHAQSTFKQIADNLKRCAVLKELESWYALFLKNNTAQDSFLMNQYITACSAFRALDSAVFAFSRMSQPNAFAYNAIIGASLTCSRPLDALRHYRVMLRQGVPPSSYTFPAVVKSCRVSSAFGLGRCVHSQALKNGLGLRIHIQTTFIDLYSASGSITDARKVFDEMSERDGFVWSAMISAHVCAGDLRSARRLLEVIPESPGTAAAAWNVVLHGYALAGDVGPTEAVFKEMPEKDVISWTTMIDCYSKCGLHERALRLFDEMRSGAGIRPDESTMATVISACAHLGALQRGMEMHLYAAREYLNLDVYVGSALIDMYSKCGMLERALVVFFKLREKNLFCWSSIIDGLALHGRAREALSMFEKIERDKIELNGVVFVSVLAACVHAGLVEEGKRIFERMTNEYYIPSEIEHYGCMVDLLCRAGLLEEALLLIQSMRMEPNSVIWGSLLGGCKLHKNLDIARVALERLVILEPSNSGYYSLLVNMHAEAGRWGEVTKVRAAIRELGVEKVSPGSSWIEVGREMHQFAACDNYHPALEQIYVVLDMLELQLKRFGYAAEFEFYEGAISGLLSQILLLVCINIFRSHLSSSVFRIFTPRMKKASSFPFVHTNPETNHGGILNSLVSKTIRQMVKMGSRFPDLFDGARSAMFASRKFGTISSYICIYRALLIWTAGWRVEIQRLLAEWLVSMHPFYLCKKGFHFHSLQNIKHYGHI